MAIRISIDAQTIVGVHTLEKHVSRGRQEHCINASSGWRAFFSYSFFGTAIVNLGSGERSGLDVVSKSARKCRERNVHWLAESECIFFLVFVSTNPNLKRLFNDPNKTTTHNAK